ncbi:MAG: hypothetical protein RJQ09_00790 [Cyclobacteriaceae bacterium]
MVSGQQKKLELEYITEHKSSYDSFIYEIRRLEIFENETAVVSGVGLIYSHAENAPYQIRYHSSNVLIKRDSRWQAINSHVSGVVRTEE